MANTVIQLKHSLVTDKPSALNIAEPAYSYSSNTFYIGSPSGTGSIAIGGKFYLDQQQVIYDRGNSAFAQSNSAASYANAAFAAANTAAASTGAYAHANAAFNSANAGFLQANTAQATGVAAGNYANASFTQANTATDTATSAGVYANGAFAAANAATATDATQNTNITTAQNSAAAAFVRANNSINANNGGTITGDLNITGNLVVGGNTSYINTEILTVEDSLIKLANNNTTGDVLDIGFYGLYNSSGQKYAGLARPAATDTFFLFKGLTQDPTANALASGSVTAANAATLIANVQAYSVTINNQDINQFATNAYTQANTAVANAAAGSSAANAAFGVANTAVANAAAASSYANSAYGQANTATTNAATADAKAVTAGSYANSAFSVANSALSLATGTAVIANTDVTGISISSGDYGSASAVAAFKVEANGRISSANSTSIAIDAAAITSGTLGITRGGTGAATFTNNGVLLGQGTSAFATASSSTEGHVLTINASGVPAFSYLSGGTF